MNRQQYICIKKIDPQIKTRKQFIQILSLLEENQEFTVADVIPKLPKLRTSNVKTIENNVTRAIRFGKSIGIIEEKQEHAVTLKQFRALPTIINLQKQLKKSRIINGSESEKISGTFKSYSNELWHFSNWLEGKTINLEQEIRLESGQYTKETSLVQIDDIEHFLNLYKNSVSNRENAKFVRICLDYLHQESFSKYSSSKMNIIFSAIKAYFRANLSSIEIPYNPKNNHAEILEENKQEVIMTLDDLFKILTQGRPSITQKAVIISKFQRGLDDSTFADRFNYIIWDRLVEFFGSAEFDSWNLSLCPMPVWLTRVKTGYYHLGFLDVDAIRIIQDYLRFMKVKKEKIFQAHEPLFLTTKGKPVSTQWVSRLIPELAKNAGVQKILTYYKTNIKRNAKTSHELRDLLKSIMISQGLPTWLCEMCIGHRVADSYEKQAQLFPEQARSEYMKISRTINIFTKTSQKLNTAETEFEIM
ncbi:MAG: hypothetical protein ACT4N5_04395, partial [Nitrosopumilaceae archaeon]